MITCPTCHSNQPDGVAFCDECGASLAAVMAPVPPSSAAVFGAPTVLAGTCPTCGAAIAPGAPFCADCGAALGQPHGVPAPVAPVGNAYAPAGGITCHACGAQLEPGSGFCDMCGAPVSQGFAAPSIPQAPAYPPPSTVQAPAYPQAPYPQVGSAGAQAPWPQFQQGFSPPQDYGVAVSVGIQGRLIVQGTNATLPFPGGKYELFVGREDPVSGYFPEIDLTNHGGDEGGVSRKHARIFAQGNQLMIEDLNSVNFTFLNQQKLVPHQPQPLNDGDELRFGRVKVMYYG